MSADVKVEPMPPAGLLGAAKGGDVTAMLALSDWFRENGGPPGVDLPLGFLLLAHECERAAVSLRHMETLLGGHFTAAPPYWVCPPPARRPTRRSASRIARSLRKVGFTPIEVLSWSGSSYTVALPWGGEDKPALGERLIEILAAACPGTPFTRWTSRLPSFNSADAAAALLGWVDPEFIRSGWGEPQCRIRIPTSITQSPCAVAPDALRLAGEFLPPYPAARSRKDFTPHPLFADQALKTLTKHGSQGVVEFFAACTEMGVDIGRGNCPTPHRTATPTGR